MKKIKIRYSGSYVNTTSGAAVIFLGIGIFISFIKLLYLPKQTDLDFISVILPIAYILGSSILIYLLLMTVSKILNHFLFIRAFQEIKAYEAGYKVTESCCEIEEDKSEK